MGMGGEGVWEIRGKDVGLQGGGRGWRAGDPARTKTGPQAARATAAIPRGGAGGAGGVGWEVGGHGGDEEWEVGGRGWVG